MEINLSEKILDALSEDGLAPIIIYDNVEVSVTQLKDTVRMFGNGLRGSHIAADQRVLLILKDKPSFVYSFLATIAIGAIPVPINPKIEDASFRHILIDSRASAVIIDYNEYGRLKDVLKSSCYLEINKTIIDDLHNDCIVDEPGLNCLSYLLDLKNYELDNFAYYRKKRSSVAFWQYTSGTTGMPKAVQHSQETMLINTNAFAVNTLGINKTDRIYSIPKMFFGYGLGNSLFFPLLTGALVLLDESWPSLNTITDNIARFKPTILFAVPAIYSLILKNIDTIDILPFTCIRLFVSAGAPLGEDINLQWLQNFGRLITDGIGCTEIGHIYIANHSPIDNPGATGWPVNGYEVKLIDNEGIEVEDEVGELCIKPSYHSIGYWENPSKTCEKFKNGWYYSGDLFVKDKTTGAYSYKERKDNLFKSFNGRWINPAEIETLLCKMFRFKECALVGRTNEEGLMVPILFAVGTGNEPDASSVISFLKQHVESYKIPRKICYLQELPRNENGKVMRHKLFGAMLEVSELISRVEKLTESI